MGHSLISADRSTHLKTIAVALGSAMILLIVGLIARSDKFETASAQPSAQLNGPALKIGKSTTVSTRHCR